MTEGESQDIVRDGRAPQRATRRRVPADSCPASCPDLEDARSAFVAMVSHELRTPLANILGYVEMLLDLDAGPLLPEQVRLIGVVERNGKRLLSRIENLLTVSDVDAGTFVVDLAPIDVSDLVTRVQNRVASKLTLAGLQSEVSVEAELPLAHGDIEQLERALLNIIGNAIKFTSHGGTVALRVAKTRDGSLRFAVSDDGAGIPRAECDNLFQAFFRSSISQERATEGMGLGLHIVKLIVEGHGGQVGARSVRDEGTVVWFTIPTDLTIRGAAPTELHQPATTLLR